MELQAYGPADLERLVLARFAIGQPPGVLRDGKCVAMPLECSELIGQRFKYGRLAGFIGHYNSMPAYLLIGICRDLTAHGIGYELGSQAYAENDFSRGYGLSYEPFLLHEPWVLFFIVN